MNETPLDKKVGKKVGKTGIIILSCDGLEHLRGCVESIYRFTVVPYKLYIVDQGSIKTLATWVRTYANRHKIELELIRNEKNVGFPKGCNQAFDRVQEEYVCVLNDDTKVSPYWLYRLLGNLSDDVLVVGPSTNRSAQQFLPGLKHAPINITPNEVAIRAYQVQGELKAKTQVLRQVTGFCMVFTRKTLLKFGKFDERFLLGGGEEVDFCWRITTSGRKCVWVKGVYVHHIHHATFDRLELDVVKYRRKTRDILYDKWPEDKRPK